MPKILVADDEPNILMLTGVMLREAGYEVIKACNGQEAVDLAIAEQPDLIITDVIMPKKDGFEVCKTVRNTASISDTPIIILSAMGDEYNKITGFDEGADDYVTKPFSSEELKARVRALLLRYQSRSRAASKSTPPKTEQIPETPEIDRISSGLPDLDDQLYGGIPTGSNILVIGPIGSGKSSFSRRFLAEGLRNHERSLFVAIDDDPKLVRKTISSFLDKPVAEYEQYGFMRLVDAYSWSAFNETDHEAFAINGILELNQLSGVISDAGYELGQTIQNKLGGRRVIDSISSLLVNFELPSVQRFLSQIARTSHSFGGVTTLFILEAGTVSDQVLNNIKYIMDGVIEFSDPGSQRSVRVGSMKWTPYSSEWRPL